MVGVRSQAITHKSGSLALGHQYLGGWPVVRGLRIETLSGRSFFSESVDWRQTLLNGRLLGTKVNNMASRVKGLVCLWHHEHGRTYRSHDFSGGGRSRVLMSWRSTRDATSRRRVPWLATPCYLLSFPISAQVFYSFYVPSCKYNIQYWEWKHPRRKG